MVGDDDEKQMTADFFGSQLSGFFGQTHIYK
jgi:hypothetical protein